MGSSLACSLLVPEALIRALLETADMALNGGGETTVIRGDAQD